ncbi:MAG: hypothetical protein LBI28_11835 [Treponema sp.]|jgi:hypothetical protein|nr:hypothetical protein [Treponema sp.]
MKRIFLFFFLTVLITGFAFAEFQLESGFGYFFNTDNYSDGKRSFNGMNINITSRYFFTENIGIFLASDFKVWFEADNSAYIEAFKSEGINYIADESVGFKLDLNFGLALAYPINERFGIQADIGLANTVFLVDGTAGTASQIGGGASFKTNIHIERASSIGIYTNIFGRYLLMSDMTGKGYLTFGLRLDCKFTRTETVEINMAGVSERGAVTEPYFLGFSIAPFIGFLGRF